MNEFSLYDSWFRFISQDILKVKNLFVNNIVRYAKVIDNNIHSLFTFKYHIHSLNMKFPKERVVSISIDSLKCSNCGRCAEVCTRNVLSVKKLSTGDLKEVFVENPTNCIGCLRCMSSCKQQAIEVIRYK